uniref:Inner centromere protein-like n=1 Tax=Phascolarctos cinereus TaxID=38626 RepID=A0A6P5JPX3_PHACI
KRHLRGTAGERNSFPPCRIRTSPQPGKEISVSKQQSAENYLVTNKTKTAVVSLGCKDELMSKQQAESLPEPAPGTFLVVPTEVPEVQAAGSVAKLQIAQPVAVMTKPGRAPSSPGTQTQPEIELLLDLLESPQTVIGPCCDWCSVRRSLVRKFSQAHRAFLIRKDSVVPKKISSARRSSRKLALEPAVTGYITCHSYLERLLGVEVFRKASSEEEVKCARETEQEAPEGTRRRLHSQNTNKISISSPRAQPGSGSQADDDS